MDKGQIAKENFKAGYNCAQSVVLAFSDELGIDAETLLKLSSSFGGGLARLREVCGAVSGGAMVLGLLEGYTSPTDNVSKTEHYKRVRQFAEAFKAENGSIICRELLTGVKTDSSPVPDERTESYYKKRPCAEICEVAAGILQKMLEEKE